MAWVGGGRESEEANVRFVLTNTTMETTVLTTHTHTHTCGELRRPRGCTASGARVNGQGRGRHSRGREGWRKASCLTLVVAVPVHDVVCHWLVLPLYGVCEWCGWK